MKTFGCLCLFLIGCSAQIQVDEQVSSVEHVDNFHCFLRPELDNCDWGGPTKVYQCAPGAALNCEKSSIWTPEKPSFCCYK